MTEQEHVENLHHLQHARGLLELCEKQTTLCVERLV
jgi:hypothetical protein